MKTDTRVDVPGVMPSAGSTAPTDTKGSARFTPGPWVLNIISGIHDGEPVASLWVDAKNEIRSIAHVMPHKGVCAANAHLIAASPDLYAALAAIVKAYDGPTVDIGTAVSSAIDGARAALRKAEGR